MPTVQIEDVPDDVHRALRGRAADAGQSLEAYLLKLLTELARSPTLDEVLDRTGDRGGGRMPAAATVRTLRRERDGR